MTDRWWWRWGMGRTLSDIGTGCTALLLVLVVLRLVVWLRGREPGGWAAFSGLALRVFVIYSNRQKKKHLASSLSTRLMPLAEPGGETPIWDQTMKGKIH